MKTVLFVNGCVRGERSRTLQIARVYLETMAKQEDFTLVERDLSQEAITFLTAKDFDPQTGVQYPMAEALAQEFATADEIVIAAPFWEFLFPAVVSSYLEMVSIAGITFGYTDHGSEGLCKAKAMHYIYTAGDTIVMEDRLNEQYLKRLSVLYGIPKFTAVSAQGLDIDPAHAKHIVAEVCREIDHGTSGK